MIPFQTYDDEMDQVAAGGAVVMVFIVLFYAAVFAFAAYMAMRVAKKAGYNQWMGLLYLVPVANFVMLIMFVFQKWPIERELEQARAAGFVPVPAAGLPAGRLPPGRLPAGRLPGPAGGLPGAAGRVRHPGRLPRRHVPDLPDRRSRARAGHR